MPSCPAFSTNEPVLWPPGGCAILVKYARYSVLPLVAPLMGDSMCPWLTNPAASMPALVAKTWVRGELVNTRRDERLESWAGAERFEMERKDEGGR